MQALSRAPRPLVGPIPLRMLPSHIANIKTKQKPSLRLDVEHRNRNSTCQLSHFDGLLLGFLTRSRTEEGGRKASMIDDVGALKNESRAGLSPYPSLAEQKVAWNTFRINPLLTL
jgi:hypothetical protein